MNIDKQTLVLLIKTRHIELSKEDNSCLAAYLSIDNLDEAHKQEPFVTMYTKGKQVAEKLLNSCQ